MAQFVYILCALTSFLCAVFLYRGYRRNPSRLLMWSAICFVGLALNNILLYIDVIILPYPEYDLSVPRSIPALAGLLCLVWGLIVDAV